jgi:hypothetical protein
VQSGDTACKTKFANFCQKRTNMGAYRGPSPGENAALQIRCAAKALIRLEPTLQI